jgi:hypothetical protein
MLTLLLMLVAAGCLLSLRNWRWGIMAAIVVGLLQDPLRKGVPGAPAYLVMACLPVWTCAVGAAGLSGEWSVQHFLNRFPRLGRWILCFAGYLLLPAAISATYGHNSWLITLLGAVVYGLTFGVLLAGWRFPARGVGAERILAFYAGVTALMLIGGPLESWGFQEHTPLVGTTAFGHVWVTYRTGAPVYMLAGFFRGPDVMGWHASLVFMIAVIMAFRSKGPVRWIWIAVAVWGILNIWLCGRRKMLAMVPVFLGCYSLLIFRFKNMQRILSIAGTAVMIGGIGWYLIASLYRNEAVERFYLSTLTEAEERVETHGIRSVWVTIRQAGFWGYGMGMSQQGVHNIQADKPRLWQESGPSKLVAELGVPGTVLFLGMGAIMLLTAYHVIRRSAHQGSFYVTAGILGILLANAASSVVSAQIFGDPLVAFLLAFLYGLLLADAGVTCRSAGPDARMPPVDAMPAQPKP